MGVAATLRSALAGLTACGLLFVLWQVAEAVDLLQWEGGYAAGAGDLWEGNLTVHAWLIGIATALAGLLAARVPSTGDRAHVWAAVGAFAGGLVVGAVLGGSVATPGASGDRGDILLVGVVAAVTGALVVLAGAVSAGALPGLVLGASLPWIAHLGWPYALAFPGLAGTALRLDSVLVPLACALLPSMLAVLVSQRRGEAWSGVVLGAVPASGLLLVSYDLAGPGGGDHLSQIVPFWFIHLLAPAVVLAVAARRGAVHAWQALPRTARPAALLAGPVAMLTLFIPYDGFILSRDGRFSFTGEVILLVTGAVVAMLAAIAVATAVGAAILSSTGATRADLVRQPV